MMGDWTRRALISGGVASVAAGLLYAMSPWFWNRFAADLVRGVPLPPHIPDPARWPDTGVHAAWIGHATVLLKVDGHTILTDPVFSDRAGINLFGPFTLGLKRLVAPALDARRMPRIDTILLSHAHMDHFDIPSLRALESNNTTVVTARSTSDLLRVPRYRQVHELGWDEHVSVGPATFRGFRVNHWGARMRRDTYRGYNGYTIDVGRWRILFAGDTANTDLFTRIKGPRDYHLAMMPIGAYNPWIKYHCNPEQAWRMGNEAGTERFLPMHHQTFQLSHEPLHEPIERFQAAAGRSQDRVLVRSVGEELHLS